MAATSSALKRVCNDAWFTSRNATFHPISQSVECCSLAAVMRLHNSILENSMSNTRPQADDYAQQELQARVRAIKLLQDMGYSVANTPEWRFEGMVDLATSILRQTESPLRHECTERIHSSTYKLIHHLHLPKYKLAAELSATATERYPHLSVFACIKPAESLPDVELTLTSSKSAATTSLISEACGILMLLESQRDAHELDYEQEYHCTAHDAATETTPSLPACSRIEGVKNRRHLRMRCEFIGDVMLARALLCPYVVRWSDANPPGRSDWMDHEADFEIVDEDISLDELRWLLNQATDMHVAAQTLSYAERYTGERMNHDYLDRITPRGRVRAQLRKRLAKDREFAQANWMRTQNFFSSVANSTR